MIAYSLILAISVDVPQAGMVISVEVFTVVRHVSKINKEAHVFARYVTQSDILHAQSRKNN